MSTDQTVTKDAPGFARIFLGLIFTPVTLWAIWEGSVASVEFIGNRAASIAPWLQDFTTRHSVWSPLIYFAAAYALAVGAVLLLIGSEKARRPAFRVVLALPFVLPLVVTIYVGLYLVGVLAWNTASVYVAPIVIKYRLAIPLVGLIVVAAAVCSYAAYTARKFKQLQYGLAELLFGLGSIVFSVYSVVVGGPAKNGAQLVDTDYWQAFFGFAAGVYIIVRGLANVEEALKQGALKPRTLYHVMFVLFPIAIADWRRRADVEPEPYGADG